MKKRLRKKKHLKEFTEYGIKIDLRFEEHPLERDILIDKFIDFVEGQGLVFGGLLSKERIEVVYN